MWAVALATKFKTKTMHKSKRKMVAVKLCLKDLVFKAAYKKIHNCFPSKGPVFKIQKYYAV